VQGQGQGLTSLQLVATTRMFVSSEIVWALISAGLALNVVSANCRKWNPVPPKQENNKINIIITRNSLTR